MKFTGSGHSSSISSCLSSAPAGKQIPHGLWALSLLSFRRLLPRAHLVKLRPYADTSYEGGQGMWIPASNMGGGAQIVGSSPNIGSPCKKKVNAADTAKVACWAADFPEPLSLEFGKLPLGVRW